MTCAPATLPFFSPLYRYTLGPAAAAVAVVSADLALADDLFAGCALGLSQPSAAKAPGVAQHRTAARSHGAGRVNRRAFTFCPPGRGRARGAGHEAYRLSRSGGPHKDRPFQITCRGHYP